MSSRSRAIAPHALNSLVVLMGLSCAGAQAQDRPYYIGVSQAFTHESNVFHSASSAARADTVSSTGLLGGLSLDLGRQHLFADVTAAANRYRDLDLLDNTSYTLSTGLNWQTVEHLSGNLSAVARQNLSQLGIFGAPDLKNVEKLTQAAANVRYGFASHLGIEAGAQHRTLKYTETIDRNLTERVAHAGLRWGTPGSVLTLGVSGRFTDGDAPHFRAPIDPSNPSLGFWPETPDSYTRKDLDFTAVWTPSALSTVSGRISVSRENHTVDARPDVSGITGSVSWDYKPTGKLGLKTTYTRDTGTQLVFTTSLQSAFFPVESNTSRINNMLSLDADYAVTGKIALTGSLAYNDGATLDVSGRGAGSTSNKAALGARYQATRTISLGCNASRESYASYRNNVAGCSAQMVLP